MKHFLLLGGLFFYLFFTHCVNATHIVGGDINMQCLNPKEPGNYKIIVSLYFDDLNGSITALDNNITVVIFRKSDNLKMMEIPIALTSRVPVIYTNPACATLRSLKTSLLQYVKIIELLPQSYDDPDGYYIVWERCCRNGDIDNIMNPKNAGMVFYMAFPALIRKGAPFVNSTPTFQPLNGEYVCRNEIFEINYDAIDIDGDVLKYSLVTPYNGFTDDTNPNAPSQGSSNYPLVVWKSGYGVTKQIDGSPSLTVHPQKGVLNVKANTLGLHVISVLCEEFRNGEKIGEVRRDFQFLVVDCANNSPAPHTISLASQAPISEVTFCEGTEVELVSNNPRSDWNYQWQRNGDNIAGATKTTLLTKEEGEYVVVASFKNICGKTKTASNTIKVLLTKEKRKLAYKGKPLVCGNGKTYQISVPPFGRSVFSWFFNGDLLTSEKNAIINVVREGAYFAIVKDLDTDCIAKSDTVYVNIVKNQPVVNLKADAQKDAKCEGDSILLSASETKGFVYEWKKDNVRFDSTSKASYYVNKSGVYTVSITDSNGCEAKAVNIPITFYNKPITSLDSIAPMCVSENLRPIPLIFSPPNGTLTGVGITGKIFNPQKAGVGKHIITLTYKGQVQCQNSTAQRTVEINKVPQTNLLKRVQIFKGMDTWLNSDAKDATIFDWTPTRHLNSPSIASPSAKPDKTTLYILTTSNEWGCIHHDSTLVEVIENTMIPNVFTPNNDKVNDFWELKMAEFFADIEVSVYNRWGELVFYSKGYKEPFDGTYKGERLPFDSYVYMIKPSEQLPILKGGLLIAY
ncbi:MAG: gliding motility-associated C-terminal domain-containing protein [Arcicella sp.]|jgi:gliding motility-associated-like protein|nr:gliding motility-associated C-terminal domain-containing protein [Arcicella sp.]